MISQALIFIGAAILFVPLFKRFGLGSVLGYLVAGIAVGPHGLGFIKEAQSVLHFAELGVVLLLFIIGLEIRPRKLWTMKSDLAGLGGVQIVVCTALFGLIALAFGLNPLPAFLVGFGLSLSSTAFALQTLTEKNQFDTTHGRSSFSILLMQDLLAIPALAIIPALGSQASAQSPQLLESLLVVGAIGSLLIAGRFVMPRAFRFIASIRSREIFTAATLFVVLGVATLMQSVGLSAALGAFVAGVLLADSEFRHELESDLEPFKSLLMGLFFIAIGMGVSLELIVSRPFLIVGGALVFVLLKFIVIYWTSRGFGLSRQNGKRTALMVSQGGEFAFVIFGLMRQGELLNQPMLATLVAVVTLSMVISPIILMLEEYWQLNWSSSPEAALYDEIKDEHPQIVIAGFGRFGQVFGRILRAQGTPFVAIDHDIDQIELVRKFGNTVYYGDAARLELLEKAGVAKAKVFIVAIGSIESSLAVVRTLRDEFPQVKIMARARNRGHVFDLMDLGVEMIQRDTFDSSLNFAKKLLIELGHSESSANSIATHFKTHDEIMMNEQYKVRTDDKKFVSVSHQGMAQLAEVLSKESQQSYIASSSSSTDSHL